MHGQGARFGNRYRLLIGGNFAPPAIVTLPRLKTTGSEAMYIGIGGLILLIILLIILF